MKKLLVLLLISTASFAQEKKLKVEATEKVWAQQLNYLSAVQKYVDEANLPHGDTKNLISAMEEVKMFLSKQLIPQLDTTKKK